MKATLILQTLVGLFLVIPAVAGQTRQLASPDQPPEGLEKSDWQSIRAAHEGWKHRFHAVDGGWQANNPGQQWTTRFDGRGFVATPKDANWTWGLQFQSYGFGVNLIEVSGMPEFKAGEQRLSYQWDDHVEEWFVNDKRGMEHGFIIKERPEGGLPGEPLTFTITTVGSLKPTVSAGAQTVHFRDAAGAPVLTYSCLKVWDADGVVLPSRFERGNDGQFCIAVEEANAVYPLTIDPIAQQAYLKASNTPKGSGMSDKFGNSIAVFGDTVVVGSPFEDSGTTGVNSTSDESVTDSGAVYVFVRSGTTWSQQAYLKASNTGANDNFGYSVSVSAETVVVGAYGEDSGTTGVNSTSDESATDSGAAYVFVRSGTTWSQQAYLKASNNGSSDGFGLSVAVSGDTVVVGTYGDDSSTTGVNSTSNESATNSGAAYVFVRSGTAWSQQAYLKASNTGAGDEFGYSVAVSGDTVVVGARFEGSSTTGVNSSPNNSAPNSGATYVFVRSGTTWSQQAYLKASNTGADDRFGLSVAVSGNTVVVGANGEDSSTTGVNSTPNDSATVSGAAYVFVRSGTTWSQQAYLKASNTGVGDWFGSSVAVSGDTVVVGAQYEDSSGTGVNSTSNESATDSGAAYVFVRSGTTWSQQAYLKASNTGPFDEFGYAVAVSGDTLLVGAWGEDSSTTGVNSSPNDSASSSGAAYVFVRGGTSWSQQAYLKSDNNGTWSGDSFGISVAVSGDTAVVGAAGEDSSSTGVNSTSDESATDSGAAYVFVRSGTTWSQQAYLKASNTGSYDTFGLSVAVSGDTVVVGARSEDSSTTGVNSTPNESASDSGAAYVFVRSGTTWSQQAYLKASNTGSGDGFGLSVAVSGETLVVGAAGEDSSTTGVNSTPNESAGNSGAAYVFVRGGTNWSQQAYLKVSNTGANDRFGHSVGVSGNTVVVGANYEGSSTTGVNSAPNDSASFAGAAYVFVSNGTTWSQQAYLKASNTGSSDLFGSSVAVSGDTVVVGAPNEDSSTTGVNSTPNESATYSGAAYVFTRSGTTWSQQAYLKASNTGAWDEFGKSVAVSGDTAIVGANLEDSSTTGINSTPNESATDSGAAYVYVRSSGMWSQQAYIKASNAGVGDSFGYSVVVSGDTTVVGAYNEDSSSTGVNGSPDEKATSAGAAYIFTGLGPVINTPEIAIKQAGLVIANTGTKDFGHVVTGGSVDLDFTIHNTGSADLILTDSTNVIISTGDFTVTTQPPSSIIAPLGSTTFSVRFAPAASGDRGALLLIPNNSGPGAIFVIQLTGTATTASALFTSTVASNSSLTGNDALPNATPFDDGVSNLLKYAFNMNLAGPDASTLPPGTGTSGLPSITTPVGSPTGTLRFEFLRRKGSGLVYTPQKSTTLGGPSWSPLTATPVVTSIDDQWERVVYTEAPDPVPAPACFGRVEVVIP